MERTYKGWRDWDFKSAQKEYTAPTPLLAGDGTLLSKGWARHGLIEYDRNKVRRVAHRKEWDYYQLSDGREHVFGFELTWGIGNESQATETCLFYDGRAHKLGAVDLEGFPKADGYLKPWHFVSEDGRFDMTMRPIYDHHTDLNLLAMRMHGHQVHGLWSGTATLSDGTALTINDMYAFCEYVEDRW